MTIANQWQITLATSDLREDDWNDDHMDCFCKNPLNSTCAKLGWEAVCRYVALYNTRNEEFINTKITKIYQHSAGYRHCTAELQTPIVTRWSPKIYYIVSSYLKIETKAENLF